MKCISEEILQRYIDGEVCKDEMIMVQVHLEACSHCYNKMQEQLELSLSVSNTLNQMCEERIIIPDFTYPEKKVETVRKWRMWHFDLAAAALIVFMIGFFFQNRSHIDEDMILYYGYELEYDANRPITEQEFAIELIDDDGNLQQITLE